MVEVDRCWRPGAISLQIQSVESWQNNGCSEGFLCKNNTVDSLPQFCPPTTECQITRLSGKVCTLNDTNVSMGPFEPIICQGGWYCPRSSNDTEMLRCPRGSYCQPGASTPTACSGGSYCPEGSSFEVYLVPVAVLTFIDILLILGMLLLGLKKHYRQSTAGHLEALRQNSRIRTIKTALVGYKALPDDNDHEMTDIETRLLRQGDRRMGFETILEAGNGNGGTEETEAELAPQLQMFVDSMRKATEVTKIGLSFSYSDLSFHPEGIPRPVLQNLTGSIERGSLVAVMGGSGAGKSTFVNVLMGKTAHTDGIIAVNNVPGKMQRYKKLTGYVPQDDIVLPELTVYENVVHSAKVRLPRTWSAGEVEAHVESVIDCLELSHVRDSMVGSVGKPVISGGQRKRVSIGMELAAAPMAIFLDEPTSGLDATAASSIMRTLKAIARLGISVIVIIHQPRMEIFDMFDSLILLGNGQTIYEGPQRKVTQYFERLGFHFPEHGNHGDIITDIITGNGQDYNGGRDISKEALVAHWAAFREDTVTEDRRITISASSISEALKKRGAPRFKQMWFCLQRAMIQQYRTKGALYAEMGLAALAGSLLGLSESSKKGVLFVGQYKAPYDMLSIAADLKSAPEVALIAAIAIGLVSAAPGVKMFSEEALLHRREAEAGHSRAAYFVAKVISVLPRMVLGCLHFSTFFLLLCVSVMPWGTAFFANFLYFYCIYGLANCVSMVVRREDAPLFATMLSLIVGLLSGASPPLSKVKDWHIEWLWRACPSVWLGELYFGQLVEPFSYLYDVDMASQATGYHLHGLWKNVLVLLGIGTGYRLIAYVGMIAGRRLRR